MDSDVEGNKRWRGSTDEVLERHSKRLNEHDTRITVNEKFRWMVIGALAILSVIIGSSYLTGLL